jgi:tetratricopeptide (TPR) repeat protein
LANRWLNGRWLLILLPILLIGISGGVYWRKDQRRVDAILLQGQSLLDEREYAKASDVLENYLRERPRDMQARLLVVRASRQARAFRQAAEHLQICRDALGDAEAVVVEEALLEVARGDEAPLAALRERARQNDAQALNILEVLVQRDLDTYQLGAAMDGFTRYLEQRPDDLHALLGRGFVWERYMSFADAAEDYRRAVAAHPDNERARFKLAEALLVVGTPKEALEQYLWLAERKPQLPPIRLGLARCYRRLGELEKARQQLDSLLAEYPSHGETLWERGELEVDLGRPAQAEGFLRQAAGQKRFDRRVQYALARSLQVQGKEKEAAEFEVRVKEIDADMARLAEIRAELVKNPSLVGPRCEGGKLFLKHGEKEEGLRWLQVVLKLDPGNREAREALAAVGYPAKP